MPLAPRHVKRGPKGAMDEKECSSCVPVPACYNPLRWWQYRAVTLAWHAQAGGHYGTSPGYIRGNDDFRPRASIPFNLEVDSDDDSSIGVRKVLSIVKYICEKFVDIIIIVFLPKT